MEQKKKVPALIALKQIIESTSEFTGKEFFKALVRYLAEILDAHGVWVTEYNKEENKLNALAFWINGEYVDKYEYSVVNTPCEDVLGKQDICHIPDKVIELYPKDLDLKPYGAVSYMGIALRDIDGKILGNLALLDNKPMPEIPESFAIFKIFASKAAAELRRELIQRKVIESESKLNRLVNGTTDAIIEFNSEFKITQANTAANKVFEIKNHEFIGTDIKNLFDFKSYTKFKSSILKYNTLCDTHGLLNFEESFICLNCNGEPFPAKINLSSYLFENNLFYALYIRNIEEEVSKNIKIKELNAETTMLKEKVNAQQFNYIIGNSPPIKKCLEHVIQVASTNSNVLILGETGTGKELFAKAVHESSDRSSKHMITLNCAALPAELIESELFGHVKGAFTGALNDREGRFSIADQGSIFLDEIAELSLPLQAKLLRVIQEGTFEPVGSSKTKKVDV
ncbi:MAG: sigma 54-interacting transcriptional regulator, partial [Flavobacteriaceae bacterium]